MNRCRGTAAGAPPPGHLRRGTAAGAPPPGHRRRGTSAGAPPPGHLRRGTSAGAPPPGHRRPGYFAAGAPQRGSVAGLRSPATEPRMGNSFTSAWLLSRSVRAATHNPPRQDKMEESSARRRTMFWQ
ncbi:unnamed protein product [Arctogadus glacialis]